MYKLDENNVVIFRASGSPFALGDIIVDGKKAGTTTMSPIAFQRLLTPAEFRSLENLRKTDDDLNYNWALAERVGSIDPTSETLAASLKSAGISPRRIKAIAAGEAP